MVERKEGRVMRYEIQVYGQWVDVTEYIFRSWAGNRRLNGELYRGPVYYLGSSDVKAYAFTTSR